MNASERKAIRRAEKIAIASERSRIEFVQAAMATKQGRAWFHELLVRCAIFDGSFSGDALLEAFAKGQRNIGLMIYNDIVANCPDQFVVMMKEANIQEITNERRVESDTDDDDGDSGSEYSGSENTDG